MTDIFIVTYRKDARWLEYCLRSIQKYARGFRKTIVVYPRHDQTVLDPVCSKFANTEQHMIDEPEKGHLYQNATKTSCDLFSDADFFLHMDSDCVFTAPVTPDTYATNGKPDLWWENYTELGQDKVPGGVPWREITEHALGCPAPIETMRRFPFLYPRWLYSAVRDRIELKHGIPFLQFVLTAPLLGGAFHGYSEFNCLGVTAHTFFPEHFSIHHVSEFLKKPSYVKQYWSHSGLTPAEESELQEITKDPRAAA